MAETTRGEEGKAGWQLPSKHLLQRGVQDLPEPQPLRKYIGASIILLATARGSGELILWPFITSQMGIQFVLAIMYIIAIFFIAFSVYLVLDQAGLVGG
jgi:hypothetical protein